MDENELKKQEELLEVIDISIKRLTAPALLFVAAYFFWRGPGVAGGAVALVQVSLLVISGFLLIVGNWFVSLKRIMLIESKGLYKWIAAFFQTVAYLILAFTAAGMAVSKVAAA